MRLDAHPATNLFPLLGDDELQALAADIGEHGLVHPVVLHEGKVLDGRNRLRACELAGVEPRYVDWEANGTTPTEWVISTNLHRRHLTTGQRAAIAAEALPLLEVEAKQRQGARTDLLPTSSPIGDEVGTAVGFGRSSERAAEQFHVSPRAVVRAKYLSTHHPEAFEAVKEGRKTLNAASVEVGYERGRDHPARPVARPERTRAAVEERVEQIAAMAAKGYDEPAIAAAVGLGVERVRQVMYRHGIPTLASRIGKRRRVDADTVMEGLVTAAEPSETAIAAVDWDALDRARFADWEQRLGVAIGQLTRLRNRLKKG